MPYPEISSIRTITKASKKAGIAVEWTIQSSQPIRTVFPERPTDTTDNRQAIELAKQGRRLVNPTEEGARPDLSAAMNKFQAALKLDPGYWESRLNVAQILLLTGQLQAAFAEAS